MTITTPVVLIIFNRPDLTERVFARIAEAKPEKLFVIADGPRSKEEEEKCKLARAIIDKVDWDCDVLTNFSETNMGCGLRVVSGLDWVFSQVEEAIILEDDCLPTASFFSFCQVLLQYYRNDTRIMHISGNNFQGGKSRTNYSYFFSKYTLSNGWASWRRAWKYFDFDIKTWSEFKESNMIKYVCDDPYEQRRFLDIFEADKGKKSIWDAQWLYACWSQSGLSVIPNSNLVSNIGYRSDATHTRNPNNPYANLPTSDIWQIKHPHFVMINKEADEYTFNNFHGGLRIKKQDSPYIYIIGSVEVGS